MRTKVAAMVRAELGKKIGEEREREWRRRRAPRPRWRPSLSSIAEEGTFHDGGGAAAAVARARPKPAVVKLKTPKGGAYFGIAIAKARLWDGGEVNNHNAMSFGLPSFVF